MNCCFLQFWIFSVQMVHRPAAPRNASLVLRVPCLDGRSCFWFLCPSLHNWNEFRNIEIIENFDEVQEITAIKNISFKKRSNLNLRFVKSIRLETRIPSETPWTTRLHYFPLEWLRYILKSQADKQSFRKLTT